MRFNYGIFNDLFALVSDTRLRSTAEKETLSVEVFNALRARGNNSFFHSQLYSIWPAGEVGLKSNRQIGY